MTIAQSWAGLLADLTDLGKTVPLRMAPVLPGNTEAEIDRLQDAIGLVLPVDVREFLGVQGGQHDPQWRQGPINFQHFMTVEEMIAEHAVMSDISADWAGVQEQPSHYSGRGWSPGWLKIMSFQGDGFTIDLLPGELGVPGQVFFRPNVPDLEEPVAPSIGAFLELLRARLAAGDYEMISGTVYFR